MINELKNNFYFIEGKHNSECFISKLYEDNFFDLNLLRDLLEDIVHLIKYHKKYKNVFNEKKHITLWKLSEIFRIMLYALEGHYNPNCIDKISNLSEDYNSYVLRFEALIKSFTFDDYQIIVDYEDELGKIVD